MSTLDETPPPSRWLTLVAWARHRVRGTIGRAALAVFGFGMVNMAVGLIIAVVLTATIGVAGFGIYALGASMAYITAQALGFGLNVLLIRLTATARANADWTLLRSARRFVIYVYGAGGLMIYAVLGLIWTLTPDLADSPTLAAGLIGVGIGPCIAAHNAGSGILRGFMKIGRASVLEEIAVPLGTLVCAIALLAAGALDPLSMLVANGAMWLLAAGLSHIWVQRAWPDEAHAAALDITPRVWLKAGGLLLASALVAILVGRVEAVALAAFTSAEAVGLYMLAVRVSNVMRLPPIAVQTALDPEAARMGVQNQLDVLSQRARLAARYATLAALGLGSMLIAGCWLVAPRLDPALAGMVPIVVILVAGWVVRTAMGSPIGLLNMLGQEKLTASASVITAILGTAALFALSWAFGIWGAALATALVYGLYTLSLTVLLARRFGVHCHVLGG